MKLFTNGCSFTWGSEIYREFVDIKDPYNPWKSYPGFITDEQDTYRKENIWSHHLHKYLNTISYTNLAENAGSNQRIVRTTLDFFTNLLQTNELVNDYVAVIQWTEPSRFEVFDSELNSYINITNANIKYNVKDDYRRKVLTYRLLEDPKNFEQDWFNQMVCLSSFFTLHNLKYLFATMDERDLTFKYSETFNWLGDNKFDRQILNSHNFRYPLKHPDLQGHRIIAKRVYNRLQLIYAAS